MDTVHNIRPIPEIVGKHLIRFWAKVDIKGPDECWPWLGCKDPNGYGKFSLQRSTGTRGWAPATATRAMYKITRSDPGDLYILHSCDNPSCVNPNHLEANTAQKNMDDKRDRGRLPLGDKHWARRMPEKIPRGEERTASKLTETTVRRIREMYKAGYSSSEIGKEVGINRRHASRVITGERWGHVT